MNEDFPPSANLRGGIGREGWRIGGFLNLSFVGAPSWCDIVVAAGSRSYGHNLVIKRLDSRSVSGMTK